MICALALAVAVALSGCGSSGSTSKSQGTSSTMDVKAGQDFTISLQSNPTTGFQWQIAEPLNTKVVKKVSSVYQPSQSGTNKVGAGGVEIWTFKAAGKGQDDIKMQYVRPNDKGAKPTEERVFSVTVQ